MLHVHKELTDGIDACAIANYFAFTVGNFGRFQFMHKIRYCKLEVTVCDFTSCADCSAGVFPRFS